MNLGWPQLITLALIAMTLGIHLANHDEPRENYHVGGYIINVGIYLALLYWGGFFTAHC